MHLISDERRFYTTPLVLKFYPVEIWNYPKNGAIFNSNYIK